jgi:integrase
MDTSTPKRPKAAAKRVFFPEENVLTWKPKGRAPEGQWSFWDAGTGAARGLGILVSPKTGTRSYFCVYYFNGSPKPYSKWLGRVGELSLGKARDLTRKHRGDSREGIDPKADDIRKSDAFEAAIQDYITHEQIGRHQNKSAPETEKVILSNTKDWHHRPVATLRYQEAEKLLQTIRDGDEAKGLKPRRYLANRLYSHLKDFFAWCVRSKKIATSPMTDMDKPWEGEEPRQRDWFKKTAAEKAVAALWRAADEIGGNEGKYLKTMILTGKRKTDLASMRWEQIEGDWFWDPPPSKSKNKRLHGVPLPNLAQRVLHPRQSQGLVFGKIMPSQLDRLQKKARETSGMGDFFWHGVRHLVETKLGELKVLPHIRDLLFDHTAMKRSLTTLS